MRKPHHKGRHLRRLGITQRVDVSQRTGERRDGLDQRWAPLAHALGFALIPLANMETEDAAAYLEALGLDAILLSGGNSLSHLDPEASDAAPERDRFEETLIRYATQHAIPIVGVCRGMQMLNHFFGGRLQALNGHVACTHGLTVEGPYADMIEPTANSYHNWGIAHDGLGRDLSPLAFDEKNNVEAFVHDRLPLAGIMWHPERMTPVRTTDLKLLTHFLA